MKHFFKLMPLLALSLVLFSEAWAQQVLQLDLRFNPDLATIRALFENPGIGPGDILELRHANVSCTEQAWLAEKGWKFVANFFLLALLPLGRDKSR